MRCDLWTWTVTLLVSTARVSCFLPGLTLNTPADTYSHEQITMEGVKMAVANFLTDNKLVLGSFQYTDEVLDEYFKNDFDSRERFIMRIKDLTTRMNVVQRDFKDSATYTVNGERIEDAFNLVKKLSAHTRKLTSADPLDKGTQESTLNSLAKALLVIQSFYSSTNWVEMEGDSYSEAFGGEGRLPRTATAREGTCSSCDRNTQIPCENNIVTDHLTSGFRPNQDTDIPPLTTGLKCSHRWNTDDGRLAIGGIGKDTTNPTISPHAERHTEAATAAIRATTAYLYKNGKGVLSNLTVENFQSLLVLHSLKDMSRASLTIVMDVTGSMSDDIMAARKSSISEVAAVQGTPNQPADYILATFSDPENLTTGERFTDADLLIDKLNSLVVKDGGDTPEYSMAGLLKGMSLSTDGAMVFMFTDAPAKDPDRVDQVIAAAKAKRIMICTIFTSARKTPLVMDKVYTQIGRATGCPVHQSKKSELDAILPSMLREHMPSSAVMMKTFQMSPKDSDRKRLLVDQTMNLFRIEAVGASSAEDIAVEDPNGSVLEYKTGVASRYYIDGKIIVTVQNPASGQWTVVRNSDDLLTIDVTGSSSFDFTFQLSEEDETGVSYIIPGNPVAGSKYTISAQMFNLHHNASLRSIALVDLYGNEIEELETSFARIGAERLAVAEFTMPTATVRVQIKGDLSGGNSFQRTNLQVISPVTVELRLQTTSDPFPFGEPQNITYVLGYHGSTNHSFTVDVQTDVGSLSTMTYTLYPGEVNEYNFQVKGQPAAPTMTYNVSVRESDSEVVLQSLTNTVWFQAPVCDVIDNKGTCPETVDPPASCQSIKWFSRAVFSSEVTSHEISTNDANVEIVVDYTTDDGKQYVNISGDCCSPSVYLSALGPSSDMIGQCYFASGALPTYTAVSVALPTHTAVGPAPDKDTFDWTLLGWILGGVGVFLILLGTGVFVWHRRR